MEFSALRLESSIGRILLDECEKAICAHEERDILNECCETAFVTILPFEVHLTFEASNDSLLSSFDDALVLDPKDDIYLLNSIDFHLLDIYNHLKKKKFHPGVIAIDMVLIPEENKKKSLISRNDFSFSSSINHDALLHLHRIFHGHAIFSYESPTILDNENHYQLFHNETNEALNIAPSPKRLHDINTNYAFHSLDEANYNLMFQSRLKNGTQASSIWQGLVKVEISKTIDELNSTSNLEAINAKDGEEGVITIGTYILFSFMLISICLTVHVFRAYQVFKKKNRRKSKLRNSFATIPQLPCVPEMVTTTSSCLDLTDKPDFSPLKGGATFC